MTASLVSPVFVGRRTERTELLAAMRRAVDGTPEFVLVGGEAGVGKSRLVAELVTAAEEAGVRVLSGQCVQLGTDGLPFAPLVDALRVLARTMPREEFDRALGPARSTLLRLLPNVDRGPDDDVVAPPVQGAQLLELVLGLLERLAAGGPVLVVFEDLHWADQSTLELLAYLVRALRAVPVAVVGTFRSDELNRRHTLSPLLLAWDRARTVHRVDLACFDRAEVADQLAAILGREAESTLVDSVFRRSDGNPFLVEEMLGVVRAGGDAAALPPSLRDVLLARVDGLAPSTRRVLSTAAVGGRWVSEQLLLTVSGLDDAAAFAGLREAVDQHLLVVDDAGRGYTFRHALSRDAVYDDMLPGERVRLHAAYGEALSAHPELGGDDPAAVAADLAHHWYAAQDMRRALGASVHAAELARKRLAAAEALQQLERSMKIWPGVPDAEQVAGIDQVELLRRASDAATESGNVYRALALLGQAIDALGEEGDPLRLAHLMERRATALSMSGKASESLEMLDRAVALLPAGGTTPVQAMLFNALSRSLVRTGRWREAEEMSLRAEQTAIAAGSALEEAEGRITRSLVTAMNGEHDAGIELGRGAIDIALSLGQSQTALRGFVILSDVLELIGRSAEAVEMAQRGRELAEESGLARSTGAFLAGNEAESLVRLGRYDEAERLISAALAVEPEGIFGATLHEVRSQMSARQGRSDRAREDLGLARALVGDEAELQFVRAFAITEALLLQLDGDIGGALDRLLTELAHPDLDIHYDGMLLWLACRLVAERAEDQRARGQQPEPVEPPVRARRDRFPVTNRATTAYTATSDAELHRAEGSLDAAEWQGVADLWRELGRPYELAYCLIHVTHAAALAGDRATAQAAAVEARAAAARCGAAPLLSQLEQLAVRARLDLAPAVATPPPAAGVASVDELARFGLTDREREVLAMVALGRTNPEIAKSLFISPKTASVHVSNILAKLQVSSRVEAATMAHRLGLTTG
jgi:DNA-binding CsgD family transcriptional regulator/tetratricopeptide (TPR) repeat protein